MRICNHRLNKKHMMGAKMRNRLLLLVALLVGIQAVGAGAAELLGNAGFENGFTTWASWGDGDLREEYYGLMPHGGTSFLRLWLRSGWYQDFDVKKGDAYEASAWVASATRDALKGDAFGEVKIEWRNKDGEDRETGEATSVKFDLTGEQGTAIKPNEWTLIKLPRAVAPANATHGRILVTIWCSDEKGGGCALFDDVSLKRVNP